jgi:hypothetical protein
LEHKSAGAAEVIGGECPAAFLHEDHAAEACGGGAEEFEPDGVLGGGVRGEFHDGYVVFLGIACDLIAV